MKTETLELTKTELTYLYNLILDNIDMGIYYGNKKQFDKMQKAVFYKIEEAYNTLCEQSYGMD
jgi:hypothetical protein